MITTKDEKILRLLIKEEIADVKHQCIQAGQLGKMAEKIDSLVIASAAHTGVISDMLLFQAKHDGEAKGMKEQEARELIARNLADIQNRNRWQKVVWVIMAIIGMVGIVSGIVISNKTGKKVDNLGVPVVIDKRGNTMQLPDSAQIKMFPRDFIEDTIK